MKKFLTLSYLLNFLTLLTAGCLLLDSFFYYGFSQKHFFINSRYLFIFCSLYSLVIFFLKKITVPKILNKINKILFPITLLISLLLFFLEKINYPNFVFTYFHINPTNFIFIPIFLSIVFFIYNQNTTNKLISILSIFFRKINLFLIPLFSLILSQLFSFNFKFQINLETNFISFFINYLLWFFVLIFSISLFKKKSLSLIFYISLFFLFTLTNFFKIKFFNLFFRLNDIYLINETAKFVFDSIKQLKIVEIFIIFGTLILFVKTIVNIKNKVVNQNPPLAIRFILFLISTFILTFPVFFPTQFKTLLTKSKIEIFLWGPIENCKNNGILFCFYDDLKNIKNPPPINYNQQTIHQIFSEVNSLPSLRENLELVERSGFKPNIIVILSEALWDVTKLSNTKFSKDPIPNIRKDITSTLISPTIGNATANVEFELLTGFSNYFLNGMIPYSQAVRKDMPTLFTAFKEQGYQTTAIHPYYAPMYNRPQVYKNFGLDEYISMEKMNDVQTAGLFISDKTFIKEILKQYNSTTKPQFIFALSMQNHFPFEKDIFGNPTIDIKSNLSPENKSILQTYTQGINLSDQSYQDLKNELSKSDIPTIVILFGDHLPLLNPGFQLYQEAGYDISNQMIMRSTPITVWSNFDSKIDIKQSSLSPNFLGLEVLKLAQITPKHQFACLESISQTDTVLQSNIPNKFTPKQISDYNLVQYDIIFGKQFSLK